MILPRRSRSSLRSRVRLSETTGLGSPTLLAWKLLTYAFLTAVQHMETYWAILEKVRGSSLRLTKLDDEIYEHLKTDFPEFDPAATIDENDMKSKAGKERWRKFMMAYEKKIGDYNFGTMMRSNPKFEYGREETIFGE
jgi:hypothetical protein